MAINSNSSATALTAIVALNSDMAIGRKGDLPWHLAEDLRHFKETTLGHPVIMGRRTWESLPKRPLPGRQNIVVSRNPEFKADGADTAATLQEAIALCDDTTPFIIGGGSIYQAALPLCQRVIATEVGITVDDADTFFPPLPADEWTATDSTPWLTSKTGIPYRFITYTRK